MNCDLAATEMIAYVKGEMDKRKTKSLEEHLAICPNCREELEKARRILSWTEAASDQAVVRAAHEIIQDGIKSNASDIHVEPQSDGSLLVRLRIDGVLHETAGIESAKRHGMIARLKTDAGMNVAETRVPQDGRIRLRLEEREYDLRVHCAPSVHGEGIVMRILDRSNVLLGLDKLGFSDAHLASIQHLIGLPNGMIIVTGPTGSGKTTTLYSMLHAVNSPAIKILTVEDPVEYLLKGANQTQVHKKVGLSFPTAVRSFLRQDPDIIMVGEMRDLETAVLCVEAAMTGHLLLTCLHANHATEAVQRLLDMGVEAFVAAATVRGVVAQRLARRLCKSCKSACEADPADPALKALGITQADLSEHTIYKPEGCEECRNTGYRGRIGFYEVLEIDHDLAALIADGATEDQLLDAARAKGFRTMVDDGKDKVLAGITSPDGAFRVMAYAF